MSNSFWHNNELLLRCTNYITSILYDELSAIVQQEGLSNNSEITAFLDSINQDYYGRGVVGCDILAQFTTSSNKKLIQMLIGKTVDNIVADKMFTPIILERLEAFKEKFCAISVEE